MAALAESMISLALDAVGRGELPLAMRVLALDDQMNDLHRQVRELILPKIEAGGQLARWGLEVINSSSHFERLEDHATNLAEEVIYMAQGRNERHCHKEICRKN